jgi:pimeloyl-ACP methyl ester carboxylesterase
MSIQGSQKSTTPAPFYEKRGSGRDTIILIHGFGLNRKSWYDIADALANHAVVYMVDLIGSGDSPAPELWPYTIESQAEMIQKLILDQALSDITLIGHSYGGGVSLMLVHQMVEKGGGDLFKRLVLIAPAAYPQPLPIFIRIPRIPFLGACLLKWIPAELQIKLTLRRVLFNDQAITPERIKRYKSNIERPSYRNALIQAAQNILHRETDGIYEKIKTIATPTLLIYGENESVIIKKNLIRLSTELQDVAARTIADCGHIPHEEHPQKVADMITLFMKGSIRAGRKS